MTPGVFRRMGSPLPSGPAEEETWKRNGPCPADGHRARGKDRWPAAQVRGKGPSVQGQGGQRAPPAEGNVPEAQSHRRQRGGMERKGGGLSCFSWGSTWKGGSWSLLGRRVGPVGRRVGQEAPGAWDRGTEQTPPDPRDSPKSPFVPAMKSPGPNLSLVGTDLRDVRDTGTPVLHGKPRDTDVAQAAKFIHTRALWGDRSVGNPGHRWPFRNDTVRPPAGSVSPSGLRWSSSW